MRKKIAILILLGLSMLIIDEARGAWSFFRVPTVVLGGSAGYYRASLNNFDRYYDSHWDIYGSAQISARVYRMNYITLQYARFQKTNEVEALGKAEWDEKFLNVGLRWYGEGRKRWRYYAGFGFTFISIEEKPGLSILAPNDPNDVSTNGSGFFLELGADYIILPHVALNLEFEVSSAGEGGTPGFEGSSLGGYAFLAGINFHL